MRARLLVVLEIASQNTPQPGLVPHNDVIQALAANRSHQSLHIRILPRRSRRRDHFFDPHALGGGNHCSSENTCKLLNPQGRRRGYFHCRGWPVRSSSFLRKSHLDPESDTLALPRERLLVSAAPS